MQRTHNAIILHINTFSGFKVLSNDAEIWFLYTPVICMWLYSVLFYQPSERADPTLRYRNNISERLGKLMMKAMTSKKSPRLWGPATILLTDTEVSLSGNKMARS